MIRFKCGCGKPMQLPEEEIGRLVECPKCQRFLLVPAASTNTDPPDEEEGGPASASADEPSSSDWNSEIKPSGTMQSRIIGQAIASLVLGLTSFFLNILTGLPALMLGMFALKNIKSSGERPEARGLAIAGLIVTCIGILFNSAGLYLAYRNAREIKAVKLSQNHLKQIGLAIHAYHDEFQGLPNNIRAKDGSPLLSWRVAILPYLEEKALYDQFKLDEPWDSQNNIGLIEKMPKLYEPLRGKAKAGETFYQMFEGNNAPIFRYKEKLTFAIITTMNGTSNTGLVFEAGEPVIWSKPADLPFDKDKPLPKLGGSFDGDFHVLMCNGSVHFFKKEPDEELMKCAIAFTNTKTFDIHKLEK
jgi:hypothetical protein